jgi:hypothetical protein
MNLYVGLYWFFVRQSDYALFLRRVYPEIQWESEKMAWSTRGFSHLRSFVSELFPNEVVSATKFFVNADLSPIYRRSTLVVPKWKLIFEYQGPTVYAEQIIMKQEMLTRVRTEDISILAMKNNLTVISIPFWWTRDKASLLAEIWHIRKDLFVINGPLASFGTMASTKEAIPESVPLSERKFDRGHFKAWANDPRFENLFMKSRRLES